MPPRRCRLLGNRRLGVSGRTARATSSSVSPSAAASVRHAHRDQRPCRRHRGQRRRAGIRIPRAQYHQELADRARVPRQIGNPSFFRCLGSVGKELSNTAATPPGPSDGRVALQLQCQRLHRSAPRGERRLACRPTAVSVGVAERTRSSPCWPTPAMAMGWQLPHPAKAAGAELPPHLVPSFFVMGSRASPPRRSR